MNTKHTPGKLEYENDEAKDCESWRIFALSTDNHDTVADVPKTGDEEYDEVTFENVKRLVACWNACDGLPDPSVVPKLIAALKAAESTIRWAAQESAGRVKAEIVGGWLHHADQARAALAKGGAT